jgi:DNA-binding response OmpR family regulator
MSNCVTSQAVWMDSSHGFPICAIALSIVSSFRRLDTQRATSWRRRAFGLLQVLIHEPLRVFAQARLAENAFGKGEKIESNAIDVLVHRPRRKMV